MTQHPKDLDNQPSDKPVAVVLGGSRGLGFLVARELVDRGHQVVVAAR
ncbi:MAG: short-chain dehydrogenase, partial [Dermatophilaceae bacterium]|nr:short-chain dehydrogenase [Dermatophilaceae bacterium]